MLTWPTIHGQLRDGRACVLVSVFGARGSAPRDAGARMVVCADGGFFGTIGGGALEWRAIAHARSVMADDQAAFHVRDFALGPELGQCCGGHVSIGFEPLRCSALRSAGVLADHENSRHSFATRGVIGGDGSVQRTILDDAGCNGGPQTAIIEPSGALLERFGDWRRPLYLFGAGHVARALVLALAQHPFSVRWIDNREEAFPGHFPPNVTPYRIEDPTAVLDGAAPDGFVLVMTHDHQLDEDIVSKALSKDCFGYVGLIGSGTKKARFLKRLRGRGFSPTMTDRLICPIGIAGIGSKAPAAIATSAAAQLLIHDEAARLDAALPARSRAQALSTG